MANKPVISVYVLETGWIYLIRVCHKWGNNYWLEHTYEIPFCTKHIEYLDSFLERHPVLRSPILEAMHDYYGHNKGLVDFNQESYKYVNKTT